MHTFQSNELLEQLALAVRQEIEKTRSLQGLADERLKAAAADGGWSVVEVVAHLNFYANFYTQSIEKAMRATSKAAQMSFKPSRLGAYFTDIIGPAAANKELKKKMKTPTNGQPKAAQDLDAQAELRQYIAHQQRLLSLLEMAKNKNLQKTKVATSLSRLIKLRLGDTFRFVIAHQQRHQQQIDRLLAY